MENNSDNKTRVQELMDKLLMDKLLKRMDKKVNDLAGELSHSLGPSWQNQNLEIRQCKKCLALAIVHSHLSLREPFGTAVEYPCDPNAVDKTLEFPKGDMSPEYRAKINRVWKAPSESDSKK